MPAQSSGDPTLVAVIDSGWDRRQSHPRILPGIGLVHPQDELSILRTENDHDTQGHGTTCAQLVLAHAPDVKILPIRVFGKILECSPRSICVALRLAADRGATVANLSLATGDAASVEPLYRACEYARKAGMIVVAAASGGGGESYPATFDNVIGVRTGLLSAHAAYAFHPDEGIEVVCHGDASAATIGQRFARRSNSFATARMSGQIAALIQARGRTNPHELRRWLEEMAPMLVHRREPAKI